ncbi:aromatic ring-hydroxylating oxygenase subunit alpha [Streptomyces sp. NRRL F-2664]|uniref:aromatic ring-hydroxylating oxygenase subunit alpha n=1 Tax=Streptomyces sp. NRRL F-2664 TaxID=1463842 RepID=UPI0005B8E313|nr:Rieske 2Fe-2S domain-containing protein [Streptomyces sp. NRRL F-2664]
MFRARKYAVRETGPAPADSLRAPVLPSPDGWFCLAFCDELGPGTVLTRPLAGEEVVLYRTLSGQVRAVRPYCPHLGAHLGAGGTVEGEDIVCPFHKFAFSPSGACVRTGYGLRPPKASLVPYPVCEANGSVYVWRHALGAPPDWEVQNIYKAGGVPMSHAAFELAGHPQDVMENIFDTGHVALLHSVEITLTSGPFFDGKAVRLGLRVRRSAPLVRRMGLDHTITVMGLGTAVAEIPIPRTGGLMAIVLHCTPLTPGRIHLRVGTALGFKGAPRLPGPLSRPAAGSLSWLGTRLAQPLTLRTVVQDLPVWNHQQHLMEPRLAEGDGPVGHYRKWARQFYTGPEI